MSALVAGVLSFYASGHPDGLTHVAQALGFADTARELRHVGLTAGRLRGRRVGDARLSGGLAGLVGLAVVGLLMAGLVLLLRRRAPRSED